jgi:hypothetical protein
MIAVEEKEIRTKVSELLIIEKGFLRCKINFT